MQTEPRTIEVISIWSLLTHCIDWVSSWGAWYYCIIVWAVEKKKEPHFVLGSFRNLGISSVKNTEICNHNGFKFEFSLLLEEVRFMYKCMCLPPCPALSGD